MENIYLNDNEINSIQLPSSSSVEFITLADNLLESIDLSGLVGLTTMDVTNNSLESLDASGSPLLETLKLSGNGLTTIDLSNNGSLATLTAHSNSLSTLDLSACTNLTSVELSDNSLTAIDLAQNSQLGGIYLDNNSITSLDLSSNNSIITVHAENNQLTSLDISNASNLEELRVVDNRLTAVDFADATSLQTLHIGSNQIQNMDLSNSTGFKYLDGRSNDLHSLNLQNGNNSNLSTVILLESPDLFCIEVDDPDNWPGFLNIDEQVSYELSCDDFVNVFEGSFAIDENSEDGTLLGTLKYTGDNVTFSITSGDDSGVFQISNQGELSILDSTGLDYELATEFLLNVQITNTINTAESVIAVTVNGLNESPSIEDQEFSVHENTISTFVGNIIYDEPEDDAVIFNITEGNDNEIFVIDSDGNLSMTASLDYESTPTVELTVEIKDEEYNSSAKVTIQVQDQDDPPVAEDQSFTIMENIDFASDVGKVEVLDPDEGEVLVFSIIGGNDNGLFTIDTDGTIQTVGTIDFESAVSHTLTVQILDQPLVTVDINVTITVTDVNEAPEITNSTFTYSIKEDEENETQIFSLSVKDDDNDALSYSVFSSSNLGAIDISSSGEVFVKDRDLLDYETLRNFDVRFLVTDGTLGDTVSIDFNISDVNESPSILDREFEIPENSASNMAVGTLSATDPEGNAVTFSILSGNELGAFVIDAGNGSILTNEVSSLDFELNPKFELEISVSDGSYMDIGRATINLTNVNESPIEISLSSDTISENQAIGTIIGIFTTSDPDEGDSFTYSIDDSDLFEISGSELLSSTSFDFETGSSFGLVITSIDKGGLSIAESFTVTIIDVEETQEETPVLSIDEAIGLSVFPNPTSDFLSVKWNQFKSATLRDFSGKEIINSNKSILDLRFLKNGIYLLELRSRSHSKQIVKILKD